ncbi:MAG: bifunctional 23S rRNA (guanine(2069)-N(7))-methyltransferase RlmK/23S rRNA (guanine(2445)-N(2))-methyltransferase RlmL [Coriobacteriia bacterium]|nr:bifunctional 23S rRNA (guanine(2069)-N(7))-methyltransferase RlmK/23S rRNA (guanine(2445)-N(2))-methyltransferase RlmL [Coriobacteriia bacterium]
MESQRKEIEQERYELFVTCSRGLENILAAELRLLGASRLRPLVNGVSLQAPLRIAYRACLWLRTASRVLLVIDRVQADDADSLYQGIRSIGWENHIGKGASFQINASGTNENLKNSQYVALRAKDAIADRLRDLRGERPEVDRSRPDVNINIGLRGNRARVAIDLSGEPLHRRGYRVPSSAITAPLRETLAAAMILAGDLDSLAKSSIDAPSRLGFDTVIDPLCGSGTIAIEAALLASDRAPGLLRDYWGFSGWAKHQEELWMQILDEADERAEQGLQQLGSLPQPMIIASDIDPNAIQVATKSAKRAGVEKAIRFSQADLSDLSWDEHQPEKRMLLATNPPYGQRMATGAQLPALYSALAATVARFEGAATAVIISPDEMVETFLSNTLMADPAASYQTMNGSIETAIKVWHKSAESDTALRLSQTIAESTELANRLQKMARHRSRWAQRTGVSNYRIYDADLPDFNLAIDLYQGAKSSADANKRWLHIAEYSAPGYMDKNKTNARLAEALRTASAVLGVRAANIFLKRRQRSRGGSQYSQEQSNASATHIIEEGNLLFEIDLASRLDTGIFLDHRNIRELLRQKAKNKDCLNLFAYTGSASVYMAAGGAKSVTTVDISNTYLTWARRNMSLNGFIGRTRNSKRTQPDLYFEQEDVLSWVQQKRAARTSTEASPNRFGLILVDVPTFSNSSRMRSRSWDVQRDHVELLISVSRLLTKEGEAIFSTNLRTFKPDLEALAKAKVHLVDISAQTIPADFERNRKIHQCFIVTRVN